MTELRADGRTCAPCMRWLSLPQTKPAHFSEVNGLIFCSGQIGQDAQGNVVEGGAAAETVRFLPSGGFPQVSLLHFVLIQSSSFGGCSGAVHQEHDRSAQGRWFRLGPRSQGQHLPQEDGRLWHHQRGVHQSEHLRPSLSVLLLGSRLITCLPKMLPAEKPSRTCVQAGKLPRDVNIEIECIAAKI